MEGGAGAHEANQGHCIGCVRKEGLVKIGALVTDKEADARTAVGEVWFLDRSLKKKKK